MPKKIIRSLDRYIPQIQARFRSGKNMLQIWQEIKEDCDCGRETFRKFVVAQQKAGVFPKTLRGRPPLPKTIAAAAGHTGRGGLWDLIENKELFT